MQDILVVKKRHFSPNMAAALGVRVIVKKTLFFYLVGQTRIHLDSVLGLRSFVEIEVVLRSGQPEEEGHSIARKMIAALEVPERDLLDCAYADLLQHGADSKEADGPDNSAPSGCGCSIP